MSAACVVIDGLGVDLGGRAVVDGVDLNAQGGVISVLGPNGSGKSTLLRCVATVLAPSRGSVTVDGLDPSSARQRIEVRRRLGYLPQEVAFSSDATVFDAVDYIAVLKEFDDDRRRRHAVMDALDRVGLQHEAHRKLGTLSSGMQRRIGLAQSLTGSPTLLVLDEPASGLDPEERLRLREIVAERRTAATIVVATHLSDEAVASDVVLVIDGGRPTFLGSPSQLAALAEGRTWLQDELPSPTVRAWWRRSDGRFRCLGSAPVGAELSPPTLEDGYLTLCAHTAKDRSIA